MRNKFVEFPHPVLNNYLNDYNKDCYFNINCNYEPETETEIVIKISCELSCDGLMQFINDKNAEVIVRVTCNRSFYREIFKISVTEDNIIKIPKKYIIDSFHIQGLIIAINDYNNYKLNEFNKDYFGSFQFSIRKGDIIANEPGTNVKLHTEHFQEDPKGIVQVILDKYIDKMKIRYSSIEDKENNDTPYCDYIYICLPENEFNIYKNLQTKKYLKSNIEQFLISSFALPVITEGISLIQKEKAGEDNISDKHYVGTVWAESIEEALRKTGMDDWLVTDARNVEFANIILENIIKDSLINLSQKAKDWTTIQHDEDEIL